ncbi:MAG TPA: glycosyltransferase [Gemmatimonadales bacterium]|nr:glycosyltransferase [Gemmatimonadales bacterium]
MAERGAAEPRLAVVYQQMSPTRVPVFDAVHDLLGSAFRVFYPSVLEGDRDPKWSGTPARHQYTLLRPRSFSYSYGSMKRYVHVNPDVWPALKGFRPDCVGIWNFNPTMLLAWLYARRAGTAFIVGTDGCLRSDRFNTAAHRWVRRRVFPTADACVGTSANSRDLFHYWGQPNEACFDCWLVADTEKFAPYRDQPREYDLLFSGQFIERKLPHFFVDVIERLRREKPDVSALLIGDGPLRAGVLERLDALGVRYSAPGFLGRDAIPAAYGSAKIFLFPTKLDAYGVVANEALAVGLPILANEEPGAVGEVILDGETGFVLPLEADAWARAAGRLLSDDQLYRRLSNRGIALIQRYTPEAAAEGLVAAFRYALTRREVRR